MMKKVFVGLLTLLFGAGIFSAHAETHPYWYAVMVQSTVSKAPAQIKLHWTADPNATGYTVSRKTSFLAPWTAVATLPATATSYTDVNVVVGTGYEYQIIKTTSVGYKGTGYIYTGIERPLVENRGRVIMIVDKTYASTLAPELSRLERDYAADGWTVVRTDVNRTDSVATVKNAIKAHYNVDPANTKAVLLFGRVAVPYSGNFNPDGHPDHQGAWPADVYYGDMNGTWTDSSVNNSVAHRPENRNVPGDGKFDQSDLPSDVELAVGRVDFANMTCFSNKTPARSELDLLRQYLNKNHTFRHGMFSIQRRGVVADNFGERAGEAFASSGWRNFGSMLGEQNLIAVDRFQFFPSVKTNTYLWAYGTGGGSYTSCDGVGTSDNFAVQDVKAVFTMFLGSYFGDWDNESNFLRASLGASGYTLTTSWAGRAHWFYHHMGLGEPIATSTALSQNNRTGGTYAPQNYGTRQVHQALLGDPTLRLHAIPSPRKVTKTNTAEGVTIGWTAPSDPAIVGYHVYKAVSHRGPFTRLTATPITTVTYTDAGGTASWNYIVKAIKLEETPSGSYWNSSAGVFAAAGNGVGSAAPLVTIPNPPANLTAGAVSHTQVMLRWTDGSSNETGFQIYRRIGVNGTYTAVATVGANVTSYTDSGLTASTDYYYKICAANSAGSSAYSNEATARTLAAPVITSSATFVSADTMTGGTWFLNYGSEGYDLAGHSKSLPAYAQVTRSANSDWTWNYSTTHPAALQKPNSADRLAACWYSATSFDINVKLTDGAVHRVAFYALDWDPANRTQTVEIIDAATGTVLNTRPLSSFSNGAYLIYDLKGNVIVRVTRTGNLNGVISGIFFK